MERSNVEPDPNPDPPAAPWTCRCDGIVWGSRPSGSAGAAPKLAVFGALLGYHASPVGTYREIQGLRGGLGRRGPRVTVPFIAVDSPASQLGGRRNWALPKELAEFTGEPATGTMTAAGAGWTVSVTARAFGPWLPMRLAGQLEQPWPDGRWRAATLTGRATARPAVVRVVVRSTDGLAGWLRSGRHLGLLIRQAEFTLGRPTEVRPTT